MLGHIVVRKFEEIILEKVKS